MTWNNGHPFDNKEEDLQYLSFLHIEWQDTLIHPIGGWDDGTERARVSLPVTKLELELQAEVDKFVLSLGFSSDTAERLLERLFDGPRFLDEAGTEEGERYRLAHHLAARFVSRVFAANDRDRARERLRSFYRAGQAEKIRLASAA